MGDPTCRIDGCTGRVVARMLCGKHYQRQKKLGSVDGLPPAACPQCGVIFRPRRRDQVYCAAACKVAASIQRRPTRAVALRPDVECRFCHIQFTPRGRGKVCASEGCQRAYHSEASKLSIARARAARQPASCAECGGPFQVTQQNKVYCSPPCRRAAALRRKQREYQPAPINCQECGQTVPYKSGRRRFCGDECRRIFVARNARWRVKGLRPDHGMAEVCGLCGTDKSLVIDHDHQCCPGQRSCGKCVRGLLCRPCNVGLGMFADDPARLRAAADYIEMHHREPIVRRPPNGRPEDHSEGRGEAGAGQAGGRAPG